MLDHAECEVPDSMRPFLLLPDARFVSLWDDVWTRIAIITRNGQVYRVRFGDSMLGGNFSLDRLGYEQGMPAWKPIQFLRQPLDKNWTPLYSAAFWLADVVLVKKSTPVRVTFSTDKRTVSFDGHYDSDNIYDFVKHFMQYLELCVS